MSSSEQESQWLGIGALKACRECSISTRDNKTGACYPWEGLGRRGEEESCLTKGQTKT